MANLRGSTKVPLIRGRMQDEPIECPLITKYTKRVGVSDEILTKLFRLRKWDHEKDGPVPFNWPSRLRKTVWNPLRKVDTGAEFVPKQYQLVMAHHLGRMPRFINGDAVGLGKTIEAIIGCAWIAERVPKFKAVLMATKSTVYQWAEEFERFSTFRPWVMQDEYKGLKGYPARFAQMIDFFENDTHDILICKYTSMIGKKKKIEGKFDENGYPVQNGKESVSQEILTFEKICKVHGPNALMILDECQKFKTGNSSIRQMVMMLSKPFRQVWAMSATVIKNDLVEFYSIASAIGLRPLGYLQNFKEDFCIYREVYVGNGRHKMALEGYQRVDEIKAALRPFFLGRSQRQVKEKLPILSTQLHPLDLSEAQSKLLLDEIPNGTFILPPRVIKVAGEIILKERDPGNKMTLLSIFQLVANNPCLMDPDDLEKFYSPKLSPKEEELLDFLDGDYRGEKVIVYTKSRTWIDRFEYLTKNGFYTDRKFLRITGAENDKQRHTAKQLFQEPDGEHDLIFINSAATEGINLQQAANLFALDLPWSWGDTLQLIGRMLRLGSPHSTNTFHPLIARGTIDEFTVETLKTKKGVFEAVLGESHSAGVLDEAGDLFNLDSGMEASTESDAKFLNMLEAHVKAVGMMSYISGEELKAAIANPDRPVVKSKAKTKKGRDYEELLKGTEDLWVADE